MFTFLKLYLSPLKILISQVSGPLRAGAMGIQRPLPSLGHLQAYQGQPSLTLASRAVWQVLGGVNTEGSLMPSCISKNRVDSITL